VSLITKTIVILANSIKHHNHCIAGKCLETGQWVRPVSNAQGAELTHDQAKYCNPHGEFIVKPKQKIEMVLQASAPLVNQPENYLISDGRWQQKYVISDAELQNYLDYPADLWGFGDRVLFNLIQSGSIVIQQSLYLVKVESLRLYRNEFDKRRASFRYNMQAYDFAVTDPKFDEITQENKAVTDILCLSLGENYDGNCYKIVATIF